MMRICLYRMEIIPLWRSACLSRASRRRRKASRPPFLSILQSKAIFFILGAYFFILSHMASYGIFWIDEKYLKDLQKIYRTTYRKICFFLGIAIYYIQVLKKTINKFLQEDLHITGRRERRWELKTWWILRCTEACISFLPWLLSIFPITRSINP